MDSLTSAAAHSTRRLHPNEPATPGCDRLHLDEHDFTRVLSAVEHSYEVAWMLADCGRVDFEAFRPLTRALRILRRYRDELRDRAA